MRHAQIFDLPVETDVRQFTLQTRSPSLNPSESNLRAENLETDAPSKTPNLRSGLRFPRHLELYRNFANSAQMISTSH